MNTFGYIYLGLVTLVMILLILKVSDLIVRIKRLRKRYDLLLRGRGELKLEELLRAHSHDIELSVRKLKAMEANVANLTQNVNEGRDSLDNKVTSLHDNTNKDFNTRLDAEVNELNTKLSKLNTDFNTRLDAEVNELNTKLSKLNTDLSNHIKNVENSMSNKVSSLDKKYNKKSIDLDTKYTNEVNKINDDRKVVYKKIDERHEYDLNSIKNLIQDNYDKIMESTSKDDKAINDNLGFAIQHVALHKYNALQNQSGDLSFTLVLLDRMKNGILMTSINGRDASYTYSKEVKNGKCVSEASPEEKEALKMITN